ncbi:TNF receptor-associated factor 6-A isoform X1 [Hydra vulgaris]|uniref:TNF receptor-associated factor 6-A isoform X1 n=1 Tax=Hydra vulgaris TaxID=6087 RepID=UPI000640F924|nr:TNF receptor-associated factor 6-A-like isoform X1 [Hydra vulgaris]
MESLDAEEFGGYNADFLYELSDEHECPVCKMALREPILTLCGHRLCLSCSEEMRKRNKGVLLCPLDNTNLNSEKTFPDRAIERAILQLKVRCNNFSKNCQWTGELKAINNHLTSCQYQEVKCSYTQCSTSLLRKELSDHMETQCIYRLVICQHCNKKIQLCEKQIHVENCECQPLYCVNQCGMKMLRKEMSYHITDICANTIIPCQYLNIGCNFKGMRKEQHTHANSSTQNHLSMAISKVIALENKIMLIEKEMETKMTVLKNEMMENIKLVNKKTMLEKNKVAPTNNVAVAGPVSNAVVAGLARREEEKCIHGKIKRRCANCQLFIF